MRENRLKHHELPDEQRRRAICRSYTAVLQRRGVLPKSMQCARADDTCSGPIQNHHPDYANPRVFERLCRKHHRDVERAEGKRP